MKGIRRAATTLGIAVVAVAAINLIGWTIATVSRGIHPAVVVSILLLPLAYWIADARFKKDDEEQQ